MAQAADVAARTHQISARLAQLKPMRRGSVSERFVKCSKPGCPCAERTEARHGPYYSWTRTIAGRTRSRFLTAEQAALVRRQIEVGHVFRDDLETVWQLCEEWADAELVGIEAASEAAEKRGSKKLSRKRSRPRSKPS